MRTWSPSRKGAAALTSATGGATLFGVRFYPASLLISVAVLLPNLLFLLLPPSDAKRHGKSANPLLLTILERVGQVTSFVLPLFFLLSSSGKLVSITWILMGVLLLFYYVVWVRFFVRGRKYALLFAPMLGVPVPMATSPVLYFLLSSIVLGSVRQAVASVVLGIGHITISVRTFQKLRSEL
jgi:hypothetical protein